MKFRPVASSSSSGGEAQFSIPSSLPSKSYEELTGAGRSGAPNFRQPGIGSAGDVKSATMSMKLLPPPRPSSTEKKSGSGGGKRGMIRSPLSVLSPNRKASGSRGGGTTTSGGGSVGSSSARKLFSSPTDSSRVSCLGGSKVEGSLGKDRKRYRKSVGMVGAKSGTVVDLGSKREDVPVVEFTYPTGDVAIPGPAVLEYFHGLATAAAASACSSEGTASDLSTRPPPTHQVQLDALGTALLSLEDVLIPSAAHEEDAALRRVQSKLQRDPSGNATSIGITKEVRAFIMSLAGTAALAVAANRLEREEALGIDEARRLEEVRIARAEARAERRAERERRGEERRAEREFERERARARRKKNLPRNKELWREVALLMTNLATLQKEEKLWDAAGKELDGKEVELEERVVKMLEEQQLAKEREQDQDDSMAHDVIEREHAQVDQAEMFIRNVVDDITLSAGRIDATLASIADLMVQSDGVRAGLYDKYRADHQFYGYRGSRDTKGLVAALSQDR